MTTCATCKGTFTIELPVRYGPGEADFDIETYPCPTCRPWARGFPGLRIGERRVIEPSMPGEPAKLSEAA